MLTSYSTRTLHLSSEPTSLTSYSLLYTVCLMCGEAAYINFIVIGYTRLTDELMIIHIICEQTYHREREQEG